jgi:amino acid permease
MSKKLAEYGISDVMTLEGLIAWLLFDVLGLTITSPVVFKEEFFPMIRMICTVLFIFFIYWIFFKRESLLEKAKEMGTTEVEERKERLEQPRKGYV